MKDDQFGNKLRETPPGEPYLLGDHLALDLLNTETQMFDFWHSGDDVLRWFERCGFGVHDADPVEDPEAFMSEAKALREVTRELVEQRKNGEVGNPERLNWFLETYLGARCLQWEPSGTVRLTRAPTRDLAKRLLGPLAEEVALLLAEGDFALVRQCEHPDCVMWFYDRTKSHRRRWCSMALCGNRHKAAQFRKRVAGTQTPL